MANTKIYLKDAFRQIKMASTSDKTFSISYRKMDGSFGSKSECRNRSGHIHKRKSDFSSIRHETRQAGRAYLEYKTSTGRWQPFEIYWCLLVSFNSYTIDHRY
ncbi:hypothetical protein CLV98_1522 [Dyadobacter jejuensis]|uniref:Uncharacterized protein n=1 Tax=Dyadobacter jejuensis TaxID=1082580 RepID=A0A315ZSZ3_9BACT|nr:hypothetical protein [Dyadobacter jejuensis]PWJ48675.1 hypothetical protein CLV98_1522 [Dyadobacter jejuensis]